MSVNINHSETNWIIFIEQKKNLLGLQIKRFCLTFTFKVTNYEISDPVEIANGFCDFCPCLVLTLVEKKIQRPTGLNNS